VLYVFHEYVGADVRDPMGDVRCVIPMGDVRCVISMGDAHRYVIMPFQGVIPTGMSRVSFRWAMFGASFRWAMPTAM